MPASTEFVRAGNWVFGTGLRGPASAELFRKMEAGLQAAGSSLSRVARLDQYYPDFSCVPPYQAARKQAFERRQVAPSTSVVVSSLQDETSQVDVQVMAASSESGYQVAEVQTGLNRPDTSGYAPALRVGDLVFVAGQLARDASGQLAARGVAEETDCIVQRRILPALQAAESALELVLKAQVYLNGDEGVFREAWKRAFGARTPPTTVVQVEHPAFLTREATVEINVVAAHRAAASRIRDIKGKARGLDGLLFIGGMNSLEAAKQIFDLAHAVRGIFFHARGAAPADPGFPYSAIEVASGFTIDLWGYAP